MQGIGWPDDGRAEKPNRGCGSTMEIRKCRNLLPSLGMGG